MSLKKIILWNATLQSSKYVQYVFDTPSAIHKLSKIEE